MVTAIDVANFFIEYYNSTDDDNITNLKLQKLIYFAQAVHLARTGKPLFTEKIEAWSHGPVVYEVYNNVKNKDRPKAPITELIGKFDRDVFSEEEFASLLDTLINYGQYSASGLRNISHAPGSPWDIAFNQGMNTVIGNNEIESHFKKESLEHLDESIFDKLPTIEGEVNEYGHLVFPV